MSRSPPSMSREPADVSSDWIDPALSRPSTDPDATSTGKYGTKIWPLQTGRGTILFMPLTLHAAWLRVDTPFSDGRLFFWAENTDTSTADPVAGSNGNGGDRFGRRISETVSPTVAFVPKRFLHIRFRPQWAKFAHSLVDSSPTLQSDSLQLATATIWLPSHSGMPMARRSVLHQTRIDADSAGSVPLSAAEPSLMPWQLTGVSLEPVDALIFLSHLSSQSARGITIDRPDTWRRLRLGNDLLFWSNASKVVLEILAGQHYLPSLRPDDMGRILSSWQTSLLDARVEKQVAHLVRILPPVCRAYDIDAIAEAPPAGLLVEHFLSTMVDVMIREVGRRPVASLHQCAGLGLDVWPAHCPTPDAARPSGRPSDLSRLAFVDRATACIDRCQFPHLFCTDRTWLRRSAGAGDLTMESPLDLRPVREESDSSVDSRQGHAVAIALLSAIA